MVECQTRVLHGVGRFSCYKYICEILNHTSLDVPSAFCTWSFFSSRYTHVLLKSGEHPKSCWWFPCTLVLLKQWWDYFSTQHQRQHFIFPVSTSLCCEREAGVRTFAHTSATAVTAPPLTLKWHLVGSTARPSLSHLLATEKSTYLVQERLWDVPVCLLFRV